jgi:hypothetical protein
MTPESEAEITPEMIEAAALVLIEAEMASDTRSTRRLVAQILNRAMEHALPRSSE